MRIFGIDIGGTYLKYMMVENGKVVEVHETLSHASEGAKELMKVVFRVCDARKFDILGVSTAGQVGEKGEIRYANENIPHYTGYKLKEVLEKRYKCKVAVLNDIYAASMSELSKDRQNYYFLAIGTGIGGAYIQDGKIVTGHKLFAGQIGYLPSSDGKSIIDETASIRGLKKLTKISPRDIFTFIEKGDPDAKRVMHKWCGELIYLISMIVGFFNPKTIVISGGITRQGNRLLNLIKEQYDMIPEPYRDTFDLVIAKEENLAGVVGAIKHAEKLYVKKAK